MTTMKKMLNCLRCGWKWIARKKCPVECPACKRRDWNKKK